MFTQFFFHIKYITKRSRRLQIKATYLGTTHAYDTKFYGPQKITKTVQDRLTIKLSLKHLLTSSKLGLVLVGVPPVLVGAARPVGHLAQPVRLAEGLVGHVLELRGDGVRTPASRVVLNHGSEEPSRHLSTS
jgi:hypothetical protein